LWFGSIFAIQEDSGELEEPKQVVYKENYVVSTISDDGSENSNDSVESKIVGTRNNFLEKNGLYPLVHFLIFMVFFFLNGKYN